MGRAAALLQHRGRPPARDCEIGGAEREVKYGYARRIDRRPESRDATRGLEESRGATAKHFHG